MSSGQLVCIARQTGTSISILRLLSAMGDSHESKDSLRDVHIISEAQSPR
jgi:hypothetical protein